MSKLGDFLVFRTMITPVILRFVYWLGTLALMITGVVFIFQGDEEYGGMPAVVLGLLLLVLGPVLLRIYCEAAILFFRMNETLTEIRNKK